ncbi:hypothetical protein BaRGS_00003492, partial [Batillaria attramentaria]
STKGFQHDEALAKRIQEEFTRRVDPTQLIIYLHHAFLTLSDETMYGRTEGARLMLQLMTRRGDWVPILLQGLRHREVGLADFADRIDQVYQRENVMEIDMDDDQEAMEVDADCEPPSPGPHQDHSLQAILQGKNPQELTGKDVQGYTQFVLAKIAETLFLQYTQDLSQVRFRVTWSGDMHVLRRLLASGAVCEALERGVLTSERRAWLAKQATMNGVKWKKMALKVTAREDDLNKVETFLRVKEEFSSPKNTVGALLLKAAGDVESRNPVTREHIHCLPRLLLSFVDWLLEHHPGLAQTAVKTLSKPPLDNALVETMATCRDYFGLDNNNHGEELARVATEMIRASEGGEFPENLSFQTEAEQGRHEHGGSQGGRPYVEAEADSELEETVRRLQASSLVVPVEVPDRENTFTFASPFVADFAFYCLARMSDSLPSGFVRRALKLGSEFAVLHLIDLALELMPLSSPPGTSVATALRDILSSVDAPRSVVEMFLSCYCYFKDPDLGNLPPTFWETFSAEAKRFFLQTRRSRKPSQRLEIPQIPLLQSAGRDDSVTVREILQHVLSARQEVDLGENLSLLNPRQLQAVLTCMQFTNVARFTLEENDNGWVVLQVDDKLRLEHLSANVMLQPAMKIRLENGQVKFLLGAMPSLESVARFNLTGCTVSPDDLQLLLDAMHVESVEELTLSGIPLGTGGKLPRFSHLRRLRALDLGNTGLRDDHMAWLNDQLRDIIDLRELTLDQNVITTLGLSRLAPSLASCKTLQVLRLAYCSLDAGAAYVLGSLLAAARDLHVLNLSNCHLLDSGLEHLSQALREHVQLGKISLRSGGYSPEGLTPFLSHLAKCSRMQHLELGGCLLAEEGDAAANKLTAALSQSGLWDYLGLWKCELGKTQFMEQLHTQTWQLRGVSTLVLQDNGLRDDHIELLANAIEQGVFRYLRHLNLRQNYTGEAGAIRLSEVLSSLTYLQELLLQHSNITLAGAKRLCFAVLGMSSMLTLDLSDSYGMERGEGLILVREIEEAVDEGKATIKKVDLDPKEEEREFRVMTDPKMMGFSPWNAKPGVHADAEVAEAKQSSAEEVPPKGDKPTVEATEVAPLARGRAEPDGEKITIDDKLCIFLGHSM